VLFAIRFYTYFPAMRNYCLFYSVFVRMSTDMANKDYHKDYHDVLANETHYE